MFCQSSAAERGFGVGWRGTSCRVGGTTLSLPNPAINGQSSVCPIRFGTVVAERDMMSMRYLLWLFI